MSLLLDALKKAAEKKAQKSGQAAGDTDAASAETTRVDETEAMTRTERIDATEVDTTETEQDLTETRRPDETETTEAYTRTQRIDATEVDATETEPDLTETRRLDETEVTETYTRTERMDAGEFEQTLVDTTRIDETEIDATQVDSTEVNEGFVETERMEAADHDEIRPIGETETPNREDETGRAWTETERFDQGPGEQAGDDLSETNLSSDTTEFSAVDQGTDPTLLVMDDSIPIDRDGNTLIETDEFSAEELARLRAASQPELTQDDVTAFMGDGADSSDASGIDATAATRTVEMRPVNLDDLDRSVSDLGSDDTTLTNPEERAQRALDDTTHSGRPMSGGRIDAPGSSAPIDDDEQSTIINPESPAASVDIERLTNEQTLGAATSTTGGGYAPDNYDRTLIKLSDSDVSRIFPGIKPEPGAVMTPDYAKKVFMSKSSQHRGRYLKWMGGMALLLLMMVGLWALYDLSDESDRIDNSLARLKRDPMPGVIQPPREEKIDLFAKPVGGDAKGVTLASGDQPETPEPAASPARPETEAADIDAAGSETGTAAEPQPAKPMDQERKAESPAAVTSRPAAAVPATEKPAETAAAPTESRPARLKLSSSERIDDKDRLLNEAYGAYEQGDLSEARRRYAQVLALDPDNRDALLGMAAIEVQDGDYNRAIELYQRLLLLNPKDSEAMASLLAVANIDPQNGETRIKEMLREQPDAPYLYFTLGNMYSRQQRWAEAQAAYFQALQRKPDDANAAYNLAVSLEHLGKPEVAVEYYRRALANRDRVLATFDADQVAQRIEVLNP